MEEQLPIGNLSLQDTESNDKWPDLVQTRAIGTSDYAKVLDILDRAMIETLSVEFGDRFITQIQVLSKLIIEPSASIPIAMQKSISNTLVDFLICDRESLLPVVAIFVAPDEEDQDLDISNELDSLNEDESNLPANTLGWEKKIVAGLIEATGVRVHYVNHETLDQWKSDPYLILDELRSDLGHYKSTQVFGS